MNREKYVDESWKESAELEKEKLTQIIKPAAVASLKESPQAKSAQSSLQEEIPESLEPENEEVPVQQESPSSGMDFLNYISSLAYQAMIFIGEIPNPNTNLVTKNLEQAKFIIDTLAILRIKTKGNLNKQELDFLNGSLYELQMKFIEVYKQETAQG